MHPSLLAGCAALVAASLWLLARRRPPSSSALLDGSAVAELNRAQIGLVAAAAAGAAGNASSAELAGTPSASAQPLPRGAAQRAALLRQLSLQMAGDGPQRLAAIDTAGRLGGRFTLPLLQRGLRDVDPQVVLRSAQAMERFRGRTAAMPSGAVPQAVAAQLVAAELPSSRPLPRNVARTR